MEEKSGEDEGDYKACAECTRVCHTTHGEGLPRSVPRFSRLVPDYALPSAKDCNMQIPAFYVREHIPNPKGKFVFEGVTGAEWVVVFRSVSFKEGWKAFATDYKLEKGDQVMFALVAPKRFYVDVFDKFGMEKFSTREPVKSRVLPKTVINKGDPTRIESPVSNFASGGDGAFQRTPPSALKPHGIYPSCSGMTPGENLCHDEKSSPSSRKRTLTIRENSSQKPVENLEAEPSATSPSSIASDDSMQVQLAKSILLKSKQKKLKKRRMSSTSNPLVESVAEAAKSEGALEAAKSGGALEAEEPELCKNLQNEAEMMEVKSIVDRINKGVAILCGYVDPTGGSRGNDDETMLEKSCDVPVVAASKDDEVTPDAGHKPQDFSNEAPDQLEEPASYKIPCAHRSQDEALDEIETGRGSPGSPGEDLVLKESEGVQVAGPQPNPALQPGLVKQETDLGVARPSPQHTRAKCESCGLCRAKKTPIQPRPLKSEPVTPECPGNAEIRSPCPNAPCSSSVRATEDQKQRALIAAKNLSATTINRHATVVMRVSFNEKTYDCFVSLKCAEMLPSEATELTLLDSEGVLRIANWNADRRFLQGPGWRDFVDAHNLQLNDVLVLEALENSGQQFVALVHIFHAHEMEKLPLHPSPAVTSYVQAYPAKAYAQVTPAGPRTRSSNLLYGRSPLPTNRRKKALTMGEAVSVDPTSPATPGDPRAETRELSTARNRRRTSSSPLSTPGGARAAVLSPSSLSERMKAAVQTEPPRPRPVASTADSARADAELRGSASLTRPRRASSSPLKLATASLASVPASSTGIKPLTEPVHRSLAEDVKSEQADFRVRAKKKAVRERANLYTPHVRRKDDPKASKVTRQQQQHQPSPDGSEFQVRTQNSQTLGYPVAQIVDRRKSVQGDVLFLVELEKPVIRSSIHKKMKSMQAEKGRWWVPHHQLTKDFSSCFL